MKALGIILLIVVLSSPPLMCKSTKQPPQPLAIIGAFSPEIALIKDSMTNKKTIQLLQIPFITGKLRGKSIVLCLTSLGKVNAATTTTLLLYYFKPQMVIIMGLSGTLDPNLIPGDIVIGEKVAQHDLGDYTETGFLAEGAINALTGKRNPVFLQADQNLVDLAQKAGKLLDFRLHEYKNKKCKPKLVTGIILTGDIFISSKKKKKQLRERFKANAVEMEGAAIAQLCYQNDVPFINIRSISDTADENASYDIPKFFKIAVQNSSSLVIKIVELLK